MAEGGGEFVDNERAPLMAHTDEQDDGDVAAGGNKQQGLNLVPHPRLRRMETNARPR